MLIIKNGTVLPMIGEKIVNGALIIEDKTIKAICSGNDDRLNAALSQESVTILDAKHGIIMPGLIEAHCHMGITEEKRGEAGDDCNEASTPITPQLRAIDAINPMDAAFKTALGAGITGAMIGPGSANVVGGQFAFLKTSGRSVDKMCRREPAALKIALGENPKMNYKAMGVMPSTRMAIAAMLREELTKGRDYFLARSAAEKNGDKFTCDFRLEPYIPVFDRSIPLKVHAHRADDIQTALRIAKEFNVLLTLDHCTEGHLICDEIKESGFPCIIGPSIASRNKLEVQYLDFKTPGILAKEGILIAITTDHPVSRIQYLALCAGLAARDGLSEDDALMAITYNAAKICGVEKSVGALVPGMDADVAVFSASPLDIMARTLYTVIDGQVVFSGD